MSDERERELERRARQGDAEARAAVARAHARRAPTTQITPEMLLAHLGGFFVYPLSELERGQALLAPDDTCAWVSYPDYDAIVSAIDDRERLTLDSFHRFEPFAPGALTGYRGVGVRIPTPKNPDVVTRTNIP